MNTKQFLAALGVGLLPSTVGLAQSIELVNPILTGFYPDPSITKVGPDYYLVNSTFSYFPGIPVMHSKDLKNWKQIGNVIDRPSQMNFMGDRMTRGLFAPAIEHHNGTFYVTCTLIDHKGNFVVTAKNPAGPWSNPTFLPEVKGIDPSLFFEGDKAYVIYNSDPPGTPLYDGHRSIKIIELDPTTLKTVGEAKILVNGGVDLSKKPVWIEGPHLMKARDWYYLYAAEGGTSVNHTEVVFRSKSALGPFVPYENNPILSQRELPRDRKNPITSAGHAQFVEGPDGQTYAIFLAVRPYEGNYYNTGRETFITPVVWKNDWPVMNTGPNGVQYAYQAKFPEVKQPGALPQSGNFAYTLTFEKQLDPALLFLRTVDSTNFSLSKAKGLTLKLKPETCAELGSPAFVGKRQQHMYGSAEIDLTFAAKTANETAGLVAFQDEKHFYYLCKSTENGKPVVQLFKSTADPKAPELLAKAPLKAAAGKVMLRINADGDTYSFRFSEDGKQYNLLKDKVDARFLSTQTAGGFIGCLYGMYATSAGQPTTNTASFKSLKYEGHDPVYQK
ncbi:glycoside hydrolase family 43 protein [Hymenobacter sp. UV11]|uniref:glycoside hydrolase family 43 protein n=1 Tax=Hymenobacter sp. UV11 TaxID=1849735 RepID=UPI00105C1C0B|nr:glycoside hydrolase family 43 protein [Hymenobacter sp. UV11]TDN38720.1 xylan 1,4-beta-xylosidase [Hymenobacter sp. UV11]TFZ63454.1 glycoside hydrolase family 43 protein [Hymenobacter sp. UV11]